MNFRFKAIETTSERKQIEREINPATGEIPSAMFGKQVFTRAAMQKMLPNEIYENLIAASEGRCPIQREYADTIAVAMKEWAVSQGATHYSHWFQPLTGTAAEKHDAFIEWATPDRVIEKFSGVQLLQGEPDASSFPSGGLRSTYEARGYTGWDSSSPVFVWKAGDSVTLCIPSVFFSWTGDVLDSKIPLLRSDKKLNDTVMRLVKLCGIDAERVYSSIGLEQEYFVIDRALHDRRPDLLLAGRTLFGAPSPKGQELQDHYFGAVKERILSFMSDFENAALKLAIPVKTRHNEVAPSQHEVAPVFEKAAIAVDHNILLMELMRKIALKHNLSCLLHEKPFQALNGSGKHCNWSIVTDTGINLLDPAGWPEKNICFLVLLTAVIHGIHRHAELLRASIGSASNDCRLGGHEAPPAIISLYLGSELEGVLDDIETKGIYKKTGEVNKYNLGIPVIPELSKDNTDRNRTSPFAFTGNKFEFRAVGSSQNAAFPATVINVLLAESLQMILDEGEKNLVKKRGPVSQQNLITAFVPILQKYLKRSRGVRFSGDNYSGEWVSEAEERGLPNLKKSAEAFEALIDPRTISAFADILKEKELQSRYEIMAEQYIESINIEIKLMLDCFRTQILPVCIRYQRELSASISQYEILFKAESGIPKQRQLLEQVAKSIEEAICALEDLEKTWDNCQSVKKQTDKAKEYSKELIYRSDRLRETVDRLETMIDDQLWPFPKYREMLFLT